MIEGATPTPTTLERLFIPTPPHSDRPPECDNTRSSLDSSPPNTTSAEKRAEMAEQAKRVQESIGTDEPASIEEEPTTEVSTICEKGLDNKHPFKVGSVEIHLPNKDRGTGLAFVLKEKAKEGSSEVRLEGWHPNIKELTHHTLRHPVVQIGEYYCTPSRAISVSLAGGQAASKNSKIQELYATVQPGSEHNPLTIQKWTIRGTKENRVKHLFSYADGQEGKKLTTSFSALYARAQQLQAGQAVDWQSNTGQYVRFSESCAFVDGKGRPIDRNNLATYLQTLFPMGSSNNPYSVKSTRVEGYDENQLWLTLDLGGKSYDVIVRADQLLRNLAAPFSAETQPGKTEYFHIAEDSAIFLGEESLRRADLTFEKIQDYFHSQESSELSSLDDNEEVEEEVAPLPEPTEDNTVGKPITRNEPKMDLAGEYGNDNAKRPDLEEKRTASTALRKSSDGAEVPDLPESPRSNGSAKNRTVPLGLAGIALVALSLGGYSLYRWWQGRRTS